MSTKVSDIRTASFGKSIWFEDPIIKKQEDHLKNVRLKVCNTSLWNWKEKRRKPKGLFNETKKWILPKPLSLRAFKWSNKRKIKRKDEFHKKVCHPRKRYQFISTPIRVKQSKKNSRNKRV